jgi:hypothetical protein
MFRFCGQPPPAGQLHTPVAWFADHVDERRARRLRFQIGQRRWLVSWHRKSDGRWLARLSCPSLVFTLERTGKTRTAAIVQAVHTMNSILALRPLFQRGSPGIDEDRQQSDDSGS